MATQSPCHGRSDIDYSISSFIKKVINSLHRGYFHASNNSLLSSTSIFHIKSNCDTSAMASDTFLFAPRDLAAMCKGRRMVRQRSAVIKDDIVPAWKTPSDDSSIESTLRPTTDRNLSDKIASCKPERRLLMWKAAWPLNSWNEFWLRSRKSVWVLVVLCPTLSLDEHGVHRIGQGNQGPKAPSLRTLHTNLPAILGRLKKKRLFLGWFHTRSRT